MLSVFLQRALCHILSLGVCPSVCHDLALYQYTGQGPCRANVHKWGLAAWEKCDWPTVDCVSHRQFMSTNATQRWHNALQPVTGLPGLNACVHHWPRHWSYHWLDSLQWATKRSLSSQELDTICHQKWRHQTVPDHSRLNSDKSVFHLFPKVTTNWL